MSKTNKFPAHLRQEYNEYAADCRQEGKRPRSFTDWLNTAYYYDALDEQPVHLGPVLLNEPSTIALSANQLY